MEKSGNLSSKRLKRYRNRVRDLVRETLEKSFWKLSKTHALDELTENLEDIRVAPHVIAERLLKNS